MADNIDVKDATGATITMRTVESGGVHTPVNAGYDPVGDKILVGTARERFFDSFLTFDTVNDWEVVQTGAGMTIGAPAGGAAAGSSRYLPIASGVTTNSQTIILSRSSWRAPVELCYQISASQRIVNNALRIGFVEVDPATGAVLTDTTVTTAPAVLNARNAAMAEWSGATATTGSILTRSGGSAIDTLAAAYGTGFTTVATGTSPNWIAAANFGIALERDRVSARAWGLNVLTNTGTQFATDRIIPNPVRLYKLAIIVENGATAPASSTDWRVHMVNVMDATRLDVSPRHGGSLDGARAFPVNIATALPAGSATIGAIAALPAGTNAVGDVGVQYRTTATGAASIRHIVAAATTNATSVKATAGRVIGWHLANTTAAWKFVKLHNIATAPTAGAGVVATIAIPPNDTAVYSSEGGIGFATGIGLTIVNGSADADTTAVAAGDVVGDLFFA